jgi:hypothetical protein
MRVWVALGKEGLEANGHKEARFMKLLITIKLRFTLLSGGFFRR